MTDAYNIVYSSESLDDIRAIYLYISEELLVPENATGQVNRIRNAVRKLDSMPSRHPLVEWEPWHSMNMHFLPVDNYIVYYLVDSDKLEVSVVRIFYAGRDIKNIINTKSTK